MIDAPAYYIYLISSLPMLHFENPTPPFSYETFLEKCKGLVPERDLAALRSIASPNALAAPGSHKTVASEMREFDTALRNELVKIRAARKKVDPLKYIRQDGYFETSIMHAALRASRSPSPVEAEMGLDEARWKMLDALSVGRYFDLETIVIYGYKLLLLEKWGKIRSADSSGLLEEVLTG